jgi:enterochelin esterase-like enzyme
VQILKVPAPALANNMLGEPAEREALVYLPPSYFKTQDKYPVIYFLLGFGQNYSGLTLPNDIDAIIADGKLKEMIVVTISGVNLLGGSFYTNSPVTGNWEDFIVSDVVKYVDSQYRTIADVSGRGIAGFSMGGFGSLSIAMKHPDVFSAVFAMSPGLLAENGLGGEGGYLQIPELKYVQPFLAEIKKISTMGDKEALAAMSSSGYAVLFAFGTIFSPDPTGKPPYFQFPFSEVGGKLVKDEVIWNRWQDAHGIVGAQIGQYKANWLKLKAIGLNYGTYEDSLWLYNGCVEFAKKMAEAGIPVQVTTYAGDHYGDMVGRLTKEMLPFFSKILN